MALSPKTQRVVSQLVADPETLSQLERKAQQDRAIGGTSHLLRTIADELLELWEKRKNNDPIDWNKAIASIEIELDGPANIRPDNKGGPPPGVSNSVVDLAAQAPAHGLSAFDSVLRRAAKTVRALRACRQECGQNKPFKLSPESEELLRVSGWLDYLEPIKEMEIDQQIEKLSAELGKINESAASAMPTPPQSLPLSATPPSPFASHQTSSPANSPLQSTNSTKTKKNRGPKKETLAARNQKIVARYQVGEKQCDLAREYGLSEPRISSIIAEASDPEKVS